LQVGKTFFLEKMCTLCMDKIKIELKFLAPSKKRTQGPFFCTKNFNSIYYTYFVSR
jgi:hypothetical protein